MKPKHIAIIILTVLFLVILVQNTQVVTFRIFFWKIEVSQIILIFFVAIAGFAAGFISSKIIGRHRNEKKLLSNKR
ncbi:MAG: LapA family protein [Candidatus Mariimomonas ferrooxydans]